jgi:hypothetical protein
MLSAWGALGRDNGSSAILDTGEVRSNEWNNTFTLGIHRD